MMATEREESAPDEEVEAPTGQELFDEANAVEAPKEAAPKEAEKPEEEPQEEKEAAPERERDEQGRFKSKEEKPEHDHRIPLRELLDEREKRQQIQAQFEAMQQSMAQRQAWEQQQQQLAQQQQQLPDIFENPEWYQQQVAMMPQQINAHVARMMQMQRLEIMGDISLQGAKARDPETFDRAWEELKRRTYGGDPTWRQQILTSQSPGETLVNLYKREATLSTVGDDPQGFVEKAIEQRMSDPQFLATVLEKARSMAEAQPQRNKVKLPTSINKAGGYGTARGGTGSDSEMWDEINR
jgi:hypothetical protein